MLQIENLDQYNKTSNLARLFMPHYAEKPILMLQNDLKTRGRPGACVRRREHRGDGHGRSGDDPGLVREVDRLAGTDAELGPDPTDDGRGRDLLEQERAGLVLAEPRATVHAVQVGIRLGVDETGERFRPHRLRLRECDLLDLAAPPLVHRDNVPLELVGEVLLDDLVAQDEGVHDVVEELAVGGHTDLRAHQSLLLSVGLGPLCLWPDRCHQLSSNDPTKDPCQNSTLRLNNNYISISFSVCQVMYWNN